LKLSCIYIATTHSSYTTYSCFMNNKQLQEVLWRSVYSDTKMWANCTIQGKEVHKTKQTENSVCLQS